MYTTSRFFGVYTDRRTFRRLFRRTFRRPLVDLEKKSAIDPHMVSPTVGIHELKNHENFEPATDGRGQQPKTAAPPNSPRKPDRSSQDCERVLPTAACERGWRFQPRSQEHNLTGKRSYRRKDYAALPTIKQQQQQQQQQNR